MISFVALTELTAEQAYRLFRLRVDVFVVEQNCAYPEIDAVDAHPETRHVLAWGDDGELLACGRVFPTPDGPRFGRYVVSPAARGTGLGPGLVRAAIEYTTRWPGDLVIEAQSGLTIYYGQFGFVAEGPEYLDAGIAHRVMRIAR